LTDEFYLQIYRSINRDKDDERSQTAVAQAFAVLALLARYFPPSSQLLPIFRNWLKHYKQVKGSNIQRLVNSCLTQFQA